MSNPPEPDDILASRRAPRDSRHLARADGATYDMGLSKEPAKPKQRPAAVEDPTTAVDVAARTPADTVPVPVPDAFGSFDLRAADCFLNRELTWLNFGFRVLREAADERTPLL